ncbi:Type VI secretion protein [Paraburkholderia sabiae]|uniref:type VI secretion system protein TssA n=1 Tax=Paraburkholderia sabiae TaxID=273251 RepID=UPI001CB23669|nr:type VI secretion system protein TssA [Paraburkholderia sabiae]CAG9218721.1 Type VI secretion protein [Paraburkholderia sabiae]
MKFSNLLDALFGSRVPSELARSSQSHWDDWLAPISDDAPAGSDPAYEDDFLAIKEEVAKLSDIDNIKIVETAERLLKRSAKDVRIAAYYVYGRMRRDGAEGVASGFELLSALVDRFGDTLLPERIATRKAAFEWLAGTTFADRLDRVHGLSGIVLERTLSALALIVERTLQWPEAARPALEPLFRRFENRVETPQAADIALDVSSASTGDVAVTLFPATRIVSTSDLLDRVRQMAQFLREQPHGYLAAYRLMRCVRWDMLTELPPCEVSGKTRLVAPRTELRATLKRLLLQKQWPELLERIESAFAEGANHFWLDLQYYAFTAQEQAGGEYALARERVAADGALMLERLPGLERLSFSDGLPFADDTTLEWIARHATVRDIEKGDVVATIGIASADTDWTETELQAHDLAMADGIEAALSWLQRLPMRDGEHGDREHFLRQLVMARVAERAQRSDTALHLLASLDESTRRYHLDAWEPSLAFEVKLQLLSLLKLRANRKDADKAALAVRIDTLTGELTAIDPARAVALA